MAEAALKLFEKRLSNKSTRTRFPTSIENAFRKAIKAPPHHTDRIFLCMNFHAWLAYFLTRSAANSQRHYEGQKKDYDILAEFEKLLPTKKEDVARRLDEVKIHPTVLQHIKEWGEKLQIRVKVRLDMLLPSLRLSSSSTPAQEYAVLEEPEGSRISTVFPTQMKECIAKTGTCERYYDITTAIPKFPDVGDGDCIMEILIRADKIYWLTMALFATWAPEFRSGMRCVIFPHGATTTPERAVTVRDVREDRIDSILGSKIASAISNSQRRLAELEAGAAQTQCVKLRVDRDSTKPAVLTLCLHAESALGIAKDLYT